MTGKKQHKDKKHDNSLTFKFPETNKEKELPLPSLEDVHDSEKPNYFSFNKDNSKGTTRKKISGIKIKK